MNLVWDALGAGAVLILSALLYLVLFERGTSYRTSSPVHDLEDPERFRILTALLAVPPLPFQSLRVLREGAELYAPQVEAISVAERSVHLEAYIFDRGRCADAFIDALCERARNGVEVRVIVDAIGSLRTSHRYFDKLRVAGGRVYFYHPLRWHRLRHLNNRTHRNLLIIDGRTGFIGGAGVADHWGRTDPHPWRDYTVQVTGPVVAGLQAVFAENWLECAGELLVGPDSFPESQPLDRGAASVNPFCLAVGSTPTGGGSTKARMLVQFLLATARESIDLCTPYFIPDFGVRSELLAARSRGVKVRVLTGGPYTDHALVRRAGRRRYEQLLETGVEIWEFASHMMHAKVLIVDGSWVLLGSTNIDHRSFGLNDEVNLLVRHAALAGELRAMYEEDLLHSEQLDLGTWRRRPLSERVLATLGRLFERHQ